MNISIYDYWEILTTYTNPIQIIGKTIFYILLFFIISLVLIFILRKVILVKRNNTILKYLSYSYFVLIPCVSGFLGFKYGLANAVQNDLKEHINAYTEQLNKQFVADSTFNVAMLLTGNSKLGDVAPHISSNELIDLLAEYFYKRYGFALEATASSDKSVSGKIAYLFFKITKNKGISFLMKKGIKKIIVDQIGIDEEMTTDLMNTKIDEIIKDGLLKKIVIVQIDKIFGSIKTSVLITLGIILLIIGVEIGYAHYRIKQQQTIS